MQWIEKSLSIMSDAQKQQQILGDLDLKSPTVSEKDKQIARKMWEKSKKIAEESLGEDVLSQSLDVEIGKKVIVFFTLGKKVRNKEKIKELVRSLSESEHNVIFALSGLPDGTRRINDAIRIMAELTQEIESAPAVYLDPMRYKKYRVENAPTLMLEEHDQAVAWVEGVTDPQWIMKKIEQGETGFLGTHGPIEPVAEKNLMDEIASRLKQIDWDQKKKEVRQRYWKRYQFTDLPTAQKPRAYAFKPLYEAQQDITDDKGNIIVKKGTRINPMEVMPPTFALIVFNGSEPKQVEAAIKMGHLYGQKYRTKFITTTIPRDNGWKAYQSLEEKIGHPVYLLQDHLAQTFHLQNVPAAVSAEGQQFVVREYPPETDLLP
ncbi:TrbC family F-type conjugative pilus assembly protein [Geoalkalibacter subterraneus]|nr:TrbC family F-type conjugative pilus assembly protein [Geoalkalibacter subterraneus]